MPPSVVLDTSVLFPMTLRDTLLRAAEENLFEPRWSPDILDELRRSLIRDARAEERDVARLIAFMTSSFPRALTMSYQHRIEQMTNHPQDRHVLAAAVHADATIIVTSNLRHFPAEILGPYRITAWSPDAFLCDLVTTDPPTMSKILRQQATDLIAPPVSVSELLASLEKTVPTFARLMRRHHILDAL